MDINSIKYKARICREEDLKEVFKFFRRLGAHNVLRLKASSKIMLWKYGNKRSSSKSLSFAFIKDRNIVIGCFGILHRKMYGVFEGRKVVWGSGAMLQPEYYGFPFLYYRFANFVKKRLLTPVSMGFMNSKKLNENMLKQKNMYPVPVFLLFSRIGKKNYDLKIPGITLKKCRSFDKRFDCFFKIISKEYDHICNRDSAFLNWRYIENPENRYRIFCAYQKKNMIGYIVYRIDRGKNIGIIMDVVVMKKSAEGLFSMVFAALNYFKKKGIKEAQCLLSDKFYIREFMKMNFMVRERQFTIITILQKDLEEKYLKSGKVFHITMGDGDYRGML